MLSKLIQRILPHASFLSNKVIECYLVQDSDYLQDLSKLSGKKIVMVLQDLGLQVQLKFTKTRMIITYEFLDDDVSDADLFLSGRSLELLVFAFCKERRSRLLGAAVVRFQGDLFLLEALSHLFMQRDFLENSALPLWLKTILIQMSKKILSWQVNNFKVLQETLVDYLQEELKLLPSYRHFEFLQDDLLGLSEDLDRLEALLQ